MFYVEIQGMFYMSPLAGEPSAVAARISIRYNNGMKGIHNKIMKEVEPGIFSTVLIYEQTKGIYYGTDNSIDRNG